MTGNDDATVTANRPRRRRRRLLNLRGDMTTDDLVDVLQELWFINNQTIVRLDRGARDLLVRAVRGSSVS